LTGLERDITDGGDWASAGRIILFFLPRYHRQTKSKKIAKTETLREFCSS